MNDIPRLAVMLIIICAVVGIAFVVIRQTGVQIPQWVITIAWIVIAALVGIWAIRLLMGMA
jgi:uncharacterized protein (DUF983 family)